jgi:glutathione synthase/RimK-type ligase-like ATP-grasp enzyme
MPTIAFVTYSPKPDLTPSDQLIADALAQRGVTVIPAPWDDPSLDWSAFDAAVIRSTWNYFDKPAEFALWLNHIEAVGLPLMNPLKIIRWNMVKTYLRQMQAEGLRIVPTAWIEQHTAPDLANIVAERGWGDVLIKSTISGGAKGIHKVPAGKAADHQVVLVEMAHDCPIMIQPVLPEIHAGEISVLFAGGKFSHAVRKFPAADNIFVQQTYGGYEVPYTPSETLIAEAAAVLEIARTLADEQTITYARVDGVLIDGQFTLMELEVLEPALFITYASEVAQHFATAILEAIPSADLV